MRSIFFVVEFFLKTERKRKEKRTCSPFYLLFLFFKHRWRCRRRRRRRHGRSYIGAPGIRLAVLRRRWRRCGLGRGRREHLNFLRDRGAGLWEWRRRGIGRNLDVDGRVESNGWMSGSRRGGEREREFWHHYPRESLSIKKKKTCKNRETMRMIERASPPFLFPLQTETSRARKKNGGKLLSLCPPPLSPSLLLSTLFYLLRYLSSGIKLGATHLSMQCHMSKNWPVQWASALPSILLEQACRIFVFFVFWESERRG